MAKVYIIGETKAQRKLRKAKEKATKTLTTRGYSERKILDPNC